MSEWAFLFMKMGLCAAVCCVWQAAIYPDLISHRRRFLKWAHVYCIYYGWLDAECVCKCPQKENIRIFLGDLLLLKRIRIYSYAHTRIICQHWSCDKEQCVAMKHKIPNKNKRNIMLLCWECACLRFYVGQQELFVTFFSLLLSTRSPCVFHMPFHNICCWIAFLKCNQYDNPMHGTC